MRSESAVLAWLLVVVSATASFGDVRSAGSLASVGAQAAETELGDLVADALRAAARSPISIVPAGSLREVAIAGGEVKVERVLACLQYPDDQVAVLELTGGELARALERSVAVYPKKNLGFLQVSGVTFTFNPDAPRGSRVSSVEVWESDASKRRRIDLQARYRVATTGPLAQGGHGYFTIWKKEQVKELKKTTVREAVCQFLAGRDLIDYREKNRIEIKRQ